MMNVVFVMDLVKFTAVDVLKNQKGIVIVLEIN